MAFKKMDPEWKQRWLDALRSGNFKQGKGSLRKDMENTHCCLGVLAQITHTKYDASSYFLPRKVCSLTKLSRAIPTNPANAQSHLADMNDTNKSFTEIANWIEENL